MHLQIITALIALCSVQLSHCITPAYYAPAPVYSYGYAAAPKAAVIHAPVAYAAAAEHLHEVEKIDPNPSYHFKYGVNDPHTGDYKTAEEYRKDGIVQGSYSLAEPDGTIRTVTYTADDLHGFNAIVDKHSAKAISAVPAISAAHVVPAKYHAVVPTAATYYHEPAAAAVHVPAYGYAAPYPYRAAAPYAYAYHRR